MHFPTVKPQKNLKFYKIPTSIQVKIKKFRNENGTVESKILDFDFFHRNKGLA